MDLRPPPARPGQAESAPARTITREDLELLEGPDGWRPADVLRRFGAAQTLGEHLARLVVAGAVHLGPRRVLELTERLTSLVAQLEPRIRGLRADDGLAPRHAFLDDLLGRLRAARTELSRTRARAANAAGLPGNPDGLRFLDLLVLMAQTETVLTAHELSGRRNVTGIDFARGVAGRPPELSHAEAWLERLLGSARPAGLLLFRPPHYGRVVLVHEDGRLAYDPGAEAAPG